MKAKKYGLHVPHMIEPTTTKEDLQKLEDELTDMFLKEMRKEPVRA